MVKTFEGMSEADMLARIMDAEAGQEGVMGKLAVGAVIRNRAKTGGYGEGIKGVITKPGQFSAINDVTGYAKGQGANDIFWRQPSQESQAIANAVLAGQYEDPTEGATHYFNPKAANPKWAKGKPFRAIGNHVFGNADAGRVVQKGPYRGGVTAGMVQKGPDRGGVDASMIKGAGGTTALQGGPSRDELEAEARRRGLFNRNDLEAEARRRGMTPPTEQGMMPDPRDAADVQHALGQLARVESGQPMELGPADLDRARAAQTAQASMDPSNLVASPQKTTWDTVMGGVRDASQAIGGFNDRAMDTGSFGLLGDEFEAGLKATFQGTDDETWKQEYDRFLAERRARNEEFDDSNASMAADVAGGLMGPVGLVGRGVQAARTFAGKVGQGASHGAVVGAAEGFTQGEGGGQARLENAIGTGIIGGVTGGAIPGLAPVAKAAGAGGRTVLNALGVGTPEAKAARLITGALPDELGSRVAGKPDTLLDVGGENIRRLGQSAHSVPTKGGEEMSEFLEKRVEGQGNRIAEDAVGYLGKSGQQFFRSVQGVVGKRQKQVKPIYDRLSKQSTPVDGELANILQRPAMRKALDSAAESIENATGTPVQLDGDYIPFNVLNQAKKEIDKSIRWGKTPEGAAAGADVVNLKSLQSQLLKEMDDRFPSYGSARKVFSDSASIEDAMIEGRKFLRGDTDEYFDTFESMGKAEQEAFRLGVARELQEVVAKTADNADAARKLINSEFTRERLQLVTPGHGAFRRFLGNMQRESGYAKTRNDVLKGSQTQARQTAADTAADVAEVGLFGGFSGALKTGWNAVRNRAKGIDKRTADKISRLLIDEDIDGVLDFVKTEQGKRWAAQIRPELPPEFRRMLAQAMVAANAAQSTTEANRMNAE